MQTRLVLTLIGKDRPGLVDALAATVAEHGGNWLESRMCHLGGEFAGILRVELPAEHEAAMTAGLVQLEKQGLQVTVRPDPDTSPAPQAGATIEIVGQDRPGIVRQISKVLAQHRVNVEELLTERTSAPMSGEMLFHATIEIKAPAGETPSALRQSLERIAADLMVEIQYKEPA